MSRWDGIDEFLAVAAAMSFTGGARALGMSTTHVSRAVMKLEQRLDRQLFHRTTRKVGLTDAGRAFLERCERIAQDTEEAFDLMNERGEPPQTVHPWRDAGLSAIALLGELRMPASIGHT